MRLPLCIYPSHIGEFTVDLASSFHEKWQKESGFFTVGWSERMCDKLNAKALWRQRAE
ncbi:hypothetical protein [Vibrio vulnificus]|uniref:hypothetical protein n=1 Tax=Vibrio vulnificus TaxID=672 RepID=UPI0013EE8C88|nr:hypothetical protein [Vibrio vulnificus]MCA3880018.1 hypothetical protein [Vibrio vulnificus]MCA3946181.1 hypothetical protein [Vibrio vulnificus]